MLGFLFPKDFSSFFFLIDFVFDFYFYLCICEVMFSFCYHFVFSALCWSGPQQEANPVF